MIALHTSAQWNIAVISHIHFMVPILHSHLTVFDNFGDNWNTFLLYVAEVISVLVA
jgi:hypothetical protein